MSAQTDLYALPALRRNGIYFLLGKLLSGSLTFVLLLVLVRVLPTSAYGGYVSLMAYGELLWVIGGLGLPWAGARFIPEAYLQGAKAWLIRFMAGLIGAQGICLVILGGLSYWQRERMVEFLRLELDPAVFGWFLGIVLLEGVGRFVREALMGPLLLQNQVQLSQVMRQTLFLGGLAWTWQRGEGLGLGEVLRLECWASGLATGLALGVLLGFLRRLPARRDGQWQAPAGNMVWAAALSMYGSHLLSLASSPQVFLLLVQRYLGAEVAAVFGFLSSLYGQIARYLPTLLFLSLIRPKLVASYVSGGMKALSRNAHLIGRLSLAVLMPLLALVWVIGDPLLGWLSGGKFAAVGRMFLALLIALVPFSQRQLLETVAVVTHRSSWCLAGSLMSLGGLSVAWWGLAEGWGIWVVVAGWIFREWAFNLILQTGLKKSASYRPDTLTVLKLFLATGISGVVAWIVSLNVDRESLRFILQIAAVVACYGGLVLGLRVFEPEQWKLLSAVVRR